MARSLVERISGFGLGIPKGKINSFPQRKYYAEEINPGGRKPHPTETNISVLQDVFNGKVRATFFDHILSVDIMMVTKDGIIINGGSETKDFELTNINPIIDFWICACQLKFLPQGWSDYVDDIRTEALNKIQEYEDQVLVSKVLLLM